MENKDKILRFIKNQKLMVISTLNKNNYPESALVGFSENADLEVIFGIFNDTRKYLNLEGNKNVSLVIGFDINEKITIQYEGIANEVKGKELEQCKKIHIDKLENEEYVNNSKEKIFKIIPKWIRYSDLSKEPEEIFEISF